MKIPGLSKWNMYAGGTSAAPGKHSYDYRSGDVKFSISPISSQFGKHLGYSLTAWGLPGEIGHRWISPDGKLTGFPAALFRSPHNAAKIANQVATEKKLPARTATGQIDPATEDEETQRMIEDTRVVRGMKDNPSRRIAVTYQTITEESAAEGDYADHGWETDEDGEQVETIAEAIDYIRSRGSVEPSSSMFHPGVWYSTIDADTDYATGEEKFYSFHLKGFKPSEEHVIFNRITGRKNPPEKFPLHIHLQRGPSATSALPHVIEIHYSPKVPLDRPEDAEKLILSRFPGYAMVDHGSLKHEIYNEPAYFIRLKPKKTAPSKEFAQFDNHDLYHLLRSTNRTILTSAVLTHNQRKKLEAQSKRIALELRKRGVDPSKPFPRNPPDSGDKFSAVSRYDRKKHPEKKEYRLMTVEEAKALRYGMRIHALGQDGRVAEVKVNGNPKTWKTRPGDVDVPWKFGMYEYGTARFRGGVSDGFLVVPLSENPCADNPAISLKEYFGGLYDSIMLLEKIIKGAHYHPEEKISSSHLKDVKETYRKLRSLQSHLYETHIEPGHYTENPRLSFDAIGGMMWAIQKLREMKRDKEIRFATPIAEKPFDRAIQALSDALEHIKSTHLGGGFTENPPLTEIYSDIIEIRAKKKDGRLYRHPFGKGAGIYGLPDGSILVRSRKGKRLWKNFPKGRK